MSDRECSDAILAAEDHKRNLLLGNFKKKELLFKVVVIGDFGVGKTSIIRRYADGTFSSSYKITVGADFAIKSLDWDVNTRINLQMWDIAGHERFGSLTGVYYRHAEAAAIVFDLTRPETFKSVEKWLLDLRRKVKLPGGQQVPVVLLANKGDLGDAVIKSVPDEIVEFCKKFSILHWFITSAKENVHIDEAMVTLINAAVENRYNLQLSDNNISEEDIVHLTNDNNNAQSTQKRFRGCCQQ